MTSTLYRIYRPQTWAEVAGQQATKTTLINQLINGKLAHAYLFCGIRGIGKTTVARLLAKSVNCLQRPKGSAEPCNTCESCKAIQTGRSLDLIEIDAASNRRIDDIREIREHVPFASAGSKYKVFIIDEVHMLTTEAFNALLKTLEEPPSHVIFILATTEVHRLPATILSRCQRFDFKPLTNSELLARLVYLTETEGVKIDPTVLNDIVRLAQGSTRDAESFLGKILSLGEKEITKAQAKLVLPHSDYELTTKFIDHLIQREGVNAVNLLNTFLSDGGELGPFYTQVLEILRQLMLLKLSGKKNLDDNSINLADMLPSLTLARLQHMLNAWLSAEKEITASDIPQLPLELAILNITESNSIVNQTEAFSGRQQRSTNTPAIKAQISDEPTKTTVDFSTISLRWGEIVDRLKEFNHSLSFILSVARPTKVDGDMLNIAFQYKLHYERVNDQKIRQLIEQAVRDVTGESLRVQPVYEEANTSTATDTLTNVLNTFGGTIVN